MGAKATRGPGKPTTYEDPEERKRVHQAVRAARKLFDTGTQMAAAIGVSQPTVSAWESGDTLPSMPYLKRIAKLLQTTEGEIRSGIKAAESGIGALELAWRYDEGRWPDWVLEAARARERDGETRNAHGWTKRLQELSEGVPPKGRGR